MIPVYNEKETVGETIKQVVDILKRTRIRYELILVNDSSTDGSGEIIKDRIRKLKNTNILLCEQHVNRGFGILADLIDKRTQTVNPSNSVVYRKPTNGSWAG